jgi:hypothetical protein
MHKELLTSVRRRGAGIYWCSRTEPLRGFSFILDSSSRSGTKIFEFFIGYKSECCCSLSQFEDYQQDVILICTAPRKECAIPV